MRAHTLLRFLPCLLPLAAGAAAAAAWIVDPGGQGDFTAIQAAIDAAAPGDSVLVRPGTYDEALELGPDRDGLSVIGDGPVADIVIRGDQNIVVHIAGTDPAVRVQGLTLAGHGEYGALWVQEARLELVDCIVRDQVGGGGCLGVGGGGRIYYDSDALVTGCTFERNRDWESPGGLIVWQAHADIRGNVFRDNVACYGAGLEIYHCEGYGVSTIEDNVFVGNTATVWGGGLFNVDSSPVIRHNTFVDNGGDQKAGVWVLGGQPQIDGNVIVGSRWAIFCQSHSQYPASLPVIGDNLCWSIGETSLTNCGSADGLTIADPLFCDAANGDYHVCADSPALVDGETVFGALAEGCPACAPTATSAKSWGDLKSLYGGRR